MRPTTRTGPSSRSARCGPSWSWSPARITLIGKQVAEPDGRRALRVAGGTGIATHAAPLRAHAGRGRRARARRRAPATCRSASPVSQPVDCTAEITDEWRALRDAEARRRRGGRRDLRRPEPWFCADGRCPAVVGSTPVYTDGRHLTAAYARRLVPHLARADASCGPEPVRGRAGLGSGSTGSPSREAPCPRTRPVRTPPSRAAAGRPTATSRCPASGTGPGVIVIQEWWGLTDHIADVTDRLAAEGFVALAPDLYGGRTTHDADEAGSMMMSLPMDAGRPRPRRCGRLPARPRRRDQLDRRRGRLLHGRRLRADARRAAGRPGQRRRAVLRRRPGRPVRPTRASPPPCRATTG